MGVAVVRVGEGAEAFLAGGVEEVEAVGLAVDGELLHLFRWRWIVLVIKLFLSLMDR